MCNVGSLMNVGICCLLLSGWAVIQLIVMGVLYKIESTTLIADVVAHDYEGYEEFINKTRTQYHVTALNCWLAAAIYLFTGILSIMCIVVARNQKAEQPDTNDDEIFCEPPEEPGGPRPKPKPKPKPSPKQKESTEMKPNEKEPSTKSKEMIPNENKSSEIEPNGSKPNETKPNEKKPNDTKPKETQPKETKPKETKPKVLTYY